MAKTKWCWLAKEVKGGWKLMLCIGSSDFKPEANKIFKTIKSVEKFANAFLPSDGKIVFVHLKNTKFPIK